MAGNTRGHIIELVMRGLASSWPSDDFWLTKNYVNQLLNSAVGFAIKTNFKDEVLINGVEGVSDAFYMMLPGLGITRDVNTGWYNVTLPQPVVGLGAGWDISTFMMVSGSGAKRFAYPITQKEVPFLYNGVKGCNDDFFWAIRDKININSCKDLTKYKGNVTMLVSQTTDLTSPMNIPDTYLPVIIDYIIKTLGAFIPMPVDISSDGVDTPKVR